MSALVAHEVRDAAGSYALLALIGMRGRRVTSGRKWG